MEYTQQFEFCSDVVKQFIDTNIELYQSDLRALFDEKSWLGSFFNCDLTKLCEHNVYLQFLQSCANNETDVPRQHDAILARVKSLYVSLVMAVGTEPIQKMRENCIDAIYNMLEKREQKREKDEQYIRLRKAFNECPIILVAALGAPYYSSRRIEFIRSNGSLKTNKSDKGL